MPTHLFRRSVSGCFPKKNTYQINEIKQGEKVQRKSYQCHEAQNQVREAQTAKRLNEVPIITVRGRAVSGGNTLGLAGGE